jgi:hypothetical protein
LNLSVIPNPIQTAQVSGTRIAGLTGTSSVSNTSAAGCSLIVSFIDGIIASGFGS